MNTSKPDHDSDIQTVLVRDREGRNLFCFLERLIQLGPCEYALLTPVDTPVSLFRFVDSSHPELLSITTNNALILSIADVVLQERALTLVQSAITLTVSGELEEPDLDEEDGSDELETYELLVSFMAEGQEYGLYIPLDPLFIIARMENGYAILVEGEEHNRIQSWIEVELGRQEQDN